jgi:transcriptional regulator of acetoin/glycerol metabolism
MQYDWPGNIRELEHLIERSVLLTTGNTIQHIHLPAQKEVVAAALKKEAMVLKTIDENERDHILNMLQFCKGKITGAGGASDLLGVPASTLHSKMRRLGIRREHVM